MTDDQWQSEQPWRDHNAEQAAEADRQERRRQAEQRRAAALRRRNMLFAGIGAFAVLALGSLAYGVTHGGSSSAADDAPSASQATSPTPKPSPTSDPKPAVETTQQDDANVAATLERMPLIKIGSAKGRRVALTFDDGPSPYTPKIMKELNKADAPGTFFWLGKEVLAYTPEQWKRLPEGDFVIGNHTWGHLNLLQRTPAQQAQDIGDASYTIEKHTGHRPRLFRPPYGAFNKTTMRIADEDKMLVTLWSVDSEDYRRPGTEVIASNVLDNVTPGAIVLMHDGGGVRDQTIAALPKIIRQLKARGYELVTVPELLSNRAPLKQPAVSVATG